MKSLKCMIMLSALFFVAFLPSIQALPMNSLSSEDGFSWIGIDGLTINDSYAGYASSLWSGYYLGTFAGNNSLDYVQDLAQIYLGDEGFAFDVDFKIDTPAISDGSLTITWSEDMKSGTWLLSDAYEIGFYVVKAGPNFALYYVDPFQSSGIWSTTNLIVGHGNNPEISHFSAYPTEGFGGGEIPEPSTLLLIGTGILGLGIIGRKKLQK